MDQSLTKKQETSKALFADILAISEFIDEVAKLEVEMKNKSENQILNDLSKQNKNTKDLEKFIDDIK